MVCMEQFYPARRLSAGSIWILVSTLAPLMDKASATGLAHPSP